MRSRTTNTLLLWLFAVLALGVLVLSILYVTLGYTVYKYAFVIDAGSTHCQVNLYKWKADKLNNTGLIQQVADCDFHRPISESDFTAVATLIASCIDNTSAVMLAEAPYVNVHETPVFLGATAGMRIMNMSQPERTAAIFSNLTNQLKIGHQVGRVSIILGRDEGLFAWIGVNYIKNTFFPTLNLLSPKTLPSKEKDMTPPTYGILDLGGASAQIAHQIDNDAGESDDQTRVRLYGRNYTVSTYSNLCFGVDQAIARHLMLSLRKHIESDRATSKAIPMSCFPKDTISTVVSDVFFNNCTQFLPSKNFPWKPEYANYQFYGTSNFTECYEDIQAILDLEECQRNFRICFKESKYPKNNTKFYAVSAYYYSTILMRQKLGEQVSFDDFISFTKNICRMDKEQLVGLSKLDYKFVKKYCFQQIYIYLTLQKVYHFDATTWSNIEIAKSIDNTELGWALGYIIKETNGIPREPPRRPVISTPAYVISNFFLGFLLFFLVIVLLYRRYHRVYISTVTTPNGCGVEETTALNMIHKC